MEIKKSSIKDAGLGVFSTIAFKSGATFGPYAGEKVRADVPKVGLDTSYMWEVSLVSLHTLHKSKLYQEAVYALEKERIKWCQ